MKRRPWVAALLASLMLLLAGCGDGDGSGSTAERTEQPAKRKPDPAADRARAERINLTLGDLGPGWTIDTSPDAGASDESFDKAFDQALAAKGLGLSEAKTADADSPDFVRGEDTSVSSTTNVYEEEVTARQDFSVTASDDFLAAMSNGFNTAFRDEAARDPELKGVTFSPVVFTKVPFPVLGQEAFAAKGSTTARGPGGRVTLHFQVVGMRQDRAVALVFALNTPREFPAAELQGLAMKMAQRMV